MATPSATQHHTHQPDEAEALAPEFEQRPRLRLGAHAALRWNLARLNSYISAIELLPEEFRDWKNREKSEIVKDLIRSDWELGWNDKNRKNIYKDSNGNIERVMEHAIPVAQWAKAIIDAPENIKSTIYMLAWCGPVANISKSSDLLLRRSGEHKRNISPVTPFARYARLGVSVVDDSGRDVSSITLHDHYRKIARIGFMKEIFDRESSAEQIENAIEWLTVHHWHQPSSA